MSYPKKGGIYWVKLDPTIGSEIKKTRPAIIISNNIGNRFSDRVIVAPITTSRGIDKCYPFEVKVFRGEGGVSEDSKILLDQIRSIDKSRVGRRIGKLSSLKISKTHEAIRISLDV